MTTANAHPKVGLIGLGIMGGAFAGHLASAGVSTIGYDIVADRMQELGARGVKPSSSPAGVVELADVVITSLPSVKAFEAALFGDRGLISKARQGLLVVETSTFPLEAKESARARLADKGIGMLDAPVSGTGPQAQLKDILVIASGARADFDRVQPMLSHFARSVRYVGEFGAGSKVKYVANLLITIHTLAAAEALVLGEKAGIDRKALLEVLMDSAATSRMLQVRGPAMIADTYTTPMIKLETFQKDLDIIGAFARECRCPAPLFNASIPLYTAAGAQGMGGYDIGAVVSVLRQMAGQA